jgi:hypothetical protein
MLHARSVVVLVTLLLVGLVVSPDLATAEYPGDQLTVVPVTPGELHTTVTKKALFGGDVMITDAYIENLYKGQVVSVADTEGGIYVAVNEVFQDTLSRIIVYHSTNEGADWAQIGGFRFIGLAIQSFDMCIADSFGGKWVLGFAMTPQMDDGTIGQETKHGGSLMYGSMLSDGTHWRVKTIASMTSSTCYREPSLCSNGGGSYVSNTKFYVAAVKVTRSDNQGWKLYVNTSTNWGDTWTAADTSIAGEFIEYPNIEVDWNANPDSLCIAFTSFEYAATGFNDRDVCVARNTVSYANAWVKKILGAPTDDIRPAMAMDHSTGDIIVSYCRHNTSSGSNDVLYCYSSDQFRTYVRDSIAVTSGGESVSGITSYVNQSDHCWRSAYFTDAGTDTLYIRSMTNRLGSFHSGSRLVVNQYRPELDIPPCIGSYRRPDGTSIGLYCVYVGRGGHNVYFDASGLNLSSVREADIPVTTALMQNYPNPFNPTTSIGYTVGVVSRQWSVASKVRLAVYDLLGREVALLVDEEKQPGEYTATWDAHGMASGVYLCTLQAGGFRASKQMLLLR